MVHHKILLDYLFLHYGITENAQAWITSYLTGRRQCVTIQGQRSKVHERDCDVPHGSILGQNLYEDYTPLGDIF